MLMQVDKNYQIIIYESDNGKIKIDARFEEESIWLTQEQIAQLFNKGRSTIAEHISNAFKEKEIDEKKVCRKFRRTTLDQKEYLLKHYNLDVILSVGYRVKSHRGTQFRIWATEKLKEYIIKGFAIDDEKLKEIGGGGYWQELQTRIRDIRSSEKVFYRQILDIYATSIDYDEKSETSIKFFKKVQNKIHYAVHGQTAAEVIYNRVDSEKKFMGLTTFTGSKPKLKDVTIAKNYLTEKELRALGQIVSGYLDFAERQAEREVPMTMLNWSQHLDTILKSTGEQVLLNSGTISHNQATQKAKEEYKKYQQKTLSEVEKAYLNIINDLQKKVKNKQ